MAEEQKGGTQPPANAVSTFEKVHIVREILAAPAAAVLAVPLIVANGVLAFSSFGPDAATAGARAGIIAAVVGGTIAVLMRSSSFVISVPTNLPILVLASFIGTALAQIGDAHLVLMMVPLMIGLASLFQIAFVFVGLTGIIRLTPYPVTAGFVSGIGLLVAWRQLPQMLGIESVASLGTASGLAEILPHLFLGAAVMGATWLADKRKSRIPPLLIGFVVGYVLFHITGLLMPDIRMGATFGVISLADIRLAELPGLQDVLSVSDWPTLLTLMLTGALTLALVSTLDTAFALSAARNVSHEPTDLSRTLVGQGVGSLVSALFGGLLVSTSIALTSANYLAGGRGRISALAMIGLLLAAVVLLPQFVGTIPLPVLAAMLVMVGVRHIDRWLLHVTWQAFQAEFPERRRLARRNAAISLIVAAVTVIGQPVLGAAVGVVLASLIYMMDMNSPLIRASGDVSSWRSRRLRAVSHNELLSRNGNTAAVLRLQGVVFFGNAEDLAARVINMAESAQIVLLDFSHVREIDVSGSMALQRAALSLGKMGKRLVICGVNRSEIDAIIEKSLAGHHVAGDFDTALEWCENQLIADAEDVDEGALEIPLRESDFMRTLSDAEFNQLKRLLEPVEFGPGAYLCRAGEPSDRLWILSRGSVSVLLQVGEGQKRLAGIGPGCTVGEMGLLNGSDRSADVRADGEVTAYELTRANFDDLCEKHPNTARAILLGIASQLSDRLRETTRDAAQN